MMSPEFLKRLRALRQSRLRTQDFQKWKSANPTAPTGTGVWNAAPWTGQTAQAIVYDPATGKAYPNPAAALSAGVKNFTYQIPAGMNVDWSYWNQFTQPPAPAPAPAQTVPVQNKPLPFTYGSTGAARSPAPPDVGFGTAGPWTPAKGFANSVQKEIDANRRSQAAGFKSAADQEIDANRRSQAAGFANAAEQEMDANRRSQAAGFANAAEQEMDANRRAVAAGFANAAEQEMDAYRRKGNI